jgi:hypothetical protein
MYKRKAEGKKMGLFISQSKKGPVSEHPRKCASVTKFVLSSGEQAKRHASLPFSIKRENVLHTYSF